MSVPQFIELIPDGYSGTTRIITAMRKLAREAYADERVNQLARQVTMGCAPHDHLCEAGAILAWFQRTFRYTRLPFHPSGIQRLQTPSYTLFDAPVRTGECASLSSAMASMLMSLGAPVMYRTAGENVYRPRDFSHVYVLVSIPDVGQVPADPSYDLALGIEHPNAIVKKDWPI